MKLSIEQFYSQVTDAKLRAGYDYYYDGRLMPEYITPESFSGTISGNYDDYIYSVAFDHDGYITYAFCDCPSYSSTHFCKHLVAVIKMREEYIKGNELIYDEYSTPVFEPFEEKEEVVFSSMPVLDLDPKSENFGRNFLDNHQKTYSQIQSLKNRNKFMNDTIEYLAKNNRIDLLQEIIWTDGNKDAKYILQTFTDKHKDLIEPFFKNFIIHKNSPEILSIVDFLTDQSGIFLLLNEDWILYNLSKGYISSYLYDKILTSIIIHKYKKSFELLLKKTSKTVSFSDEVRIVEFVKENYKPEEYYALFLPSIDNHTFTSMEFDLIFPYLKEGQIEHISKQRVFRDSYSYPIFNISLNFMLFYTTPSAFSTESCTLYEIYVLRDRYFKNPRTYKTALRTFKKLAKKEITGNKVYLNRATQIAEIIRANIGDQNIYDFAMDSKIKDGFTRVYDFPTFLYADALLGSGNLSEFIDFKEFKLTKGEN